MKQTIVRFVILLALAAAPLRADPKAPKARPVEVGTVDPVSQRGLFVYEGEEIGLVLRALARMARINLVASDQITGTVDLRIEDKTPREALEIIADSKDLVIEERKKGILYVRPKHPGPPVAPKAAQADRSFDEALTELFTPAFVKFCDSLLDYQARPETVQKMARAKKALYDAFVAEGFTKDEAFHLLLTTQEPEVPGSKK